MAQEQTFAGLQEGADPSEQHNFPPYHEHTVKKMVNSTKRMLDAARKRARSRGIEIVKVQLSRTEIEEISILVGLAEHYPRFNSILRLYKERSLTYQKALLHAQEVRHGNKSERIDQRRFAASLPLGLEESPKHRDFVFDYHFFHKQFDESNPLKRDWYHRLLPTLVKKYEKFFMSTQSSKRNINSMIIKILADKYGYKDPRRMLQKLGISAIK